MFKNRGQFLDILGRFAQVELVREETGDSDEKGGGERSRDVYGSGASSQLTVEPSDSRQALTGVMDRCSKAFIEYALKSQALTMRAPSYA